MNKQVPLFTAGLLSIGLALTPALADNGKSNGHGNSSSHGNSANAHGATQASDSTTGAATKPEKAGLASELKGMNAVKANPNALAHAAPNSQVGRIAAYRDAALLTKAAQETLHQASVDLAALPVPTRDLAAIDAAIDALDPLAIDHAAALAALQAEADAVQAYDAAATALDAATEAALTAQATENDALLIASGGRILSDEAVAYIRDVLNL